MKALYALVGAAIAFSGFALGVVAGIGLSGKIGMIVYAAALAGSVGAAVATFFLNERQHKRFMVDMGQIDTQQQALFAQMKRDLGFEEALERYATQRFQEARLQ